MLRVKIIPDFKTLPFVGGYTHGLWRAAIGLPKAWGTSSAQ
jgi:hypothetical protein